MLVCDQCGEQYMNNDVYVNDEGASLCAFCLGFKSPYPFHIAKMSPLENREEPLLRKKEAV